MARGAAFGDLNNDGQLDVVVGVLDGSPVILRNNGTKNHWLGIALVGRKHRDVVGARLTLEVGNRRLRRFAQGGGSYLSSSDRRHIFGLGKAAVSGEGDVHGRPDDPVITSPRPEQQREPAQDEHEQRARDPDGQGSEGECTSKSKCLW